MSRLEQLTYGVRTGMGNGLIVDLKHFLADDGTIGPKSGPAKQLAEFLTRIVVDATTTVSDGSASPTAKCRRRPGRKACPGPIDPAIGPDPDVIYWACRACGDHGTIRNWRGSLWDCSNRGGTH